jgi:hypothetical protein
MKFFLALSILWISFTADISEEIAACIRSGNARKLSVYFGSSVDLSLTGKEDMYSRAQAEQLMRGFFQKNPPLTFRLTHRPAGSGASQYGIGSYQSINSKQFRIYFVIRRVGNQQYLQQLSIEPEKP